MFIYRLIKMMRRRRDVRVYRRAYARLEADPSTTLASDWTGLADDTDWDLLWPE